MIIVRRTIDHSSRAVLLLASQASDEKLWNHNNVSITHYLRQSSRLAIMFNGAF